jgi:hypothetical protein
MAGKSTVGSLYYEVLMDASGWTRGMTKIRSEQAMLKKSIQNLDNTMGNGTDRYKKEMLERVALLRKLLQQGKITSERFKELYKAEARAYKMYEDEKMRKAKAAANERTRIAEREAKRKARLYKERHDAVRDGQFGFKAMIGAHMSDIRKGFRQGGFQGLNQVAMSMQNMFMKFWPFLVGWQILKGVVTSISNGIRKIVREYDKMHKQMIVLTQLTGSKSVAEKLRNSLVSYAKDTAFSVEQTMELAQQMIALGVSIDQVAPKMRLFGTLAMGDPAKFKLIAKAYTDVKSLGRLMGREVIQFANQGVPILAELSAMYGVTTADLMAMIEAGRVSFEDVDKALQSIQGRYGDIDKAALETATGTFDAMTENWDQLLAKWGGGLSSFFKAMFDGLDSFINDLHRVTDSLDGMSQGWKDFWLTMSGPVGWSAMFNETEEWLGRLSWGASFLDGGAMMRDWQRSQELVLLSEQKRDAAAAEAAAIKQQNEYLLEQRELLKKQEEKLQYAERKKAEFLAATTGDDTMLKRIDAEKDIRDAYRKSIEMGFSHEEALQHAEWAKEKSKAAAAGSPKESKEKAVASAIGQLPSVMMRQNSIEEFRFLAQMRANAEREAAANSRAEQNNNNRDDNTQSIVDAIDNINVGQEIQDTVLFGGV